MAFRLRLLYFFFKNCYIRCPVYHLRDALRCLFIGSLLSITILSGCKFHHEVHSQTPQLNKQSLAESHVYNTQDLPKDHLARFHDPQLMKLVRIALRDAPDIGSAKARMVAANAVARGAYSNLWPSASLNSYAQKQRFSFKGTVPQPFNILAFNQAKIADVALNFNYELDLWGKNREIFATRLSEAVAARLEVAQTKLILESNIAQVYFALQNNRIQQKLAAENVQLLRELEGIVLDRAKQGIESDIPLKTAISNTQSARLSVQEYRRQEQRSRHQLAVLLGKNPLNTHIEPLPFSYSPQQLRLPENISTNVLAHRPDVLASQALAEAAAHQINVARTEFYPDINLKGILAWQGFYFARFFNFSLKNSGGTAAVNLPLFDAGQRRANLNTQQANFELAVNQYNQTLLVALQEVADEMATLASLSQQIEEQQRAVNTTQSNYRLFNARYQHGIIDYVQVLELKQVLVQQKSTLYTLQTQEKQAAVALLAALGGEVLYDK